MNDGLVLCLLFQFSLFRFTTVAITQTSDTPRFLQLLFSLVLIRNAKDVTTLHSLSYRCQIMTLLAHFLFLLCLLCVPSLALPIEDMQRRRNQGRPRSRLHPVQCSEAPVPVKGMLVGVDSL